MTKKVSILIPLYNSADTISQTIESCLNQTYKNIEVIIVNDGSTDESLEVASRYSSDRVKVYTQENSGSCSTRNAALAKSTGEYIQYLDADDLLSENKISNQLKLINTNNLIISSCSWEYFNYYPHDEPVVKESVFKSYQKPIEFLIESWNGGGMMQTACWLLSRELALKAGYWNENLLSGLNDDGEYFCRILLHAKEIIFTEESKVFYRKPRESNVSQNTSNLGAESLLLSYKSYEENVLLNHNNKIIKRALTKNYLEFVYRFNTLYPDLALEALNRANELGEMKEVTVGGPLMRSMIKLLGFKASINLRTSMIKFCNNLNKSTKKL